jgi:hypothetical protein
MAGGKQPIDGVRADESGAAGNDREHGPNIHGWC